MHTGDRFRVNAPDVTHETIDNEAVIINLETGHYYSLQGSGAEIWTLLATHAPIDAIVLWLTRHYACAPSEAQRAADRLIAELLAEKLIVPAHDTGTAEAAPPMLEEGSRTPPLRRLEAPVLHKFTDMQELLLLDPIHDVDERGWPHPNAGGRGGRATD
jgi:hypothetical protein